MRKVYIIKENAYTIPKLNKLGKIVLQITNFRTEVCLEMPWLVLASHSLTFHRKVYKYAQAKCPLQLESFRFIEKEESGGKLMILRHLDDHLFPLFAY